MEHERQHNRLQQQEETQSTAKPLSMDGPQRIMEALGDYFASLPQNGLMEEAAQLEGAGYMRIFWSIISPLCKPVYAAIVLFIATTQWNSWFDAYLYNRFKYEYTTLQFEIYKYFNTVTAQPGTITNMHQPRPYPITPRTLRSALAILTMLPLLIIYPFLQKYFVSGLTVRGIKD